MLLVLFLFRGTTAGDPLSYPNHISLRCPLGYFDCDVHSPSPNCVPFTAVRNCVKDCFNGADELCGTGQSLCDVNTKAFKCGQCVPVHEQNLRCSDHKWTHICADSRAIKCSTTVNCILPQWIQDGKNDCGDWSDEDPCRYGLIPCPNLHKETKEDISALLVENVTDSSVDGTNKTISFTIPDECDIGEYRCGSGECIATQMVLNEKKDCSDGSDEDYCIRFGSECRVDSRPCSYQPDIASFGCGCPRGTERTEQGNMSAYGHRAGEEIECLSLSVILEKDEIVDVFGNISHRVGFKIGGGIDQDPSRSPYRYPDTGIYITYIEPDSPAQKSGLRQHDKILRVNGHDFTMLTHDYAVKYIKKYPILEILVARTDIPQLPVQY